MLKLQELPDGIPQGEIPRHLVLYCDRYLCEKVVPGNKVFVLGIYSIKKATRMGKVYLWMSICFDSNLFIFVCRKMIVIGELQVYAPLIFV